MIKKENLWAPWRMKYILEKKEGCFLCSVVEEKNRDDKNFLVYRGKYVFIILNIYPYNNGHLMIVPIRHLKDIESLTKEEESEIFALTKRSVKILKKVMNPQGFNMGMNLGKCSGAGVEDHLHLHIVPRWVGDTNFMPIVADTKVLPQSLAELYKVLKKEFKKQK